MWCGVESDRSTNRCADRNVTVGYAVVPVTNSSPCSTPVSRVSLRRRREALHDTSVEVTALR